MERQESFTKRIAEIIGTLEAIEITRKAIGEARSQAKRRSEQQARLVNARKNNSITQEEYDTHRNLLLQAAIEYGPAGTIEGIEKTLQMHETALTLFTDLTSQNQINEETKDILHKIANDRGATIDIPKIKEDLMANLTEEEAKEVEEKTVELEASEDLTKELVKSFKTMAFTIKAAVDKLEESITILKNFLDKVDRENKNKNTAESKPVAAISSSATPAKGDGANTEKPSEANDPYAAMEANESKMSDKNEPAQDASFFEQSQRKTSGTSMDTDEIDSEEMEEDEEYLMGGGVVR